MTQLASQLPEIVPQPGPARMMDYVPPLPVADQGPAIRMAERDAAQRAGIGESIVRSAATDWSGAWLYRHLSRAIQSPAADPNFRMTVEMVKKFGDGLPTQDLERFAGVGSIEEAEILRDQLKWVNHSRDRMATAGWGGKTAQFVTGLADPAFIAAGLATGGVGAAGKVASLGTLVRHGLVDAAMVGGIEGYKATQDPDLDASGVVAMAGMAFGLSTVLRKLTNGRSAKIAQETGKLNDLSTIEYGLGAASPNELSAAARQELLARAMTDQGRAYYGPTLKRASGMANFEEAAEHLGISGADEPELFEAVRASFESHPVTPEIPVTGNADAAAGELVSSSEIKATEERPGFHKELTGTGADQDEIWMPNKPRETQGVVSPYPALKPGDLPELTLTDSRPGMAVVRTAKGSGFYNAVAGSSDIPLMRKIGNALFPDFLTKSDGSNVARTAIGWAAQRYKGLIGGFGGEYEALEKKYLEGVPFLKRGAAKDEFARQIGMTVTLDAADGQLAARFRPEILAGRTLVRKANDVVFGIVQRMGTRGFADLESKPTYLMRRWLPRMVRAAETQHGADNVVEAFTQSILNNSDGLAEKEARVIAKGFVKSIKELDEFNPDLARFFRPEGEEALRRTLAAEGLDTAAIERIVYQHVRDPETGLPKRARRKLSLDENHIATFDTGHLAISDLLDRDVRRLTRRYTRQMLGEAGMSRIEQAVAKEVGSTAENGLPATIIGAQGIKAQAAKQAEAMGITNTAFEAQWKPIEHGFKDLLGLPIEPDSVASRMLKRARLLNFAAGSGSFVFSQIPTFGGILAESGLRTLERQMPAITDIVRGVKDGRFPLAKEIEVWYGMGSDPYTRAVIGRMDDTLTGATKDASFDTGLRHIGEFQSKVSGLSWIDRVQRQVMGVVAVQKLVDQSLGAGGLSAKRLATLGLEQPMLDRIGKQMVEHGASIEGRVAPRSAIKYTNIGAWKDAEAANAMMTAVDRWASRVVQDYDIGHAVYTPLVSDSLVKTMTQFRSFAIQAWPKQTLYRLQQHEMQDGLAFLYTAMLGGLVYMGRTHAEAMILPKDERADYLEKRMAWGRIGASAYANSEMTSITPALIDTVTSDVLRHDPVFAFSRTSGLDGSLITGNPTYSLINNAIKGVQGGTGAATNWAFGDNWGAPYDRGKARSLEKIMPFARFLPAKALIERLNEGLEPAP